jgi:hypothetical protein
MAALASIRPFTTRVINPLVRPFAGPTPGIRDRVVPRSPIREVLRTPVLVFHDGSRCIFAMTPVEA